MRLTNFIRHLIVGITILGAATAVACGAASSAPRSSSTTASTAATAYFTPQSSSASATAVESASPTVAAPSATPIPPTDTPVPPPPPTAAPSTCGAPANPYGFNFCGGSLIYSPPADICSYIACIGNFWNGRGYVIQCRDGTFGKSGGIRGSCSYHGGNARPLYGH